MFRLRLKQKANDNRQCQKYEFQHEFKNKGFNQKTDIHS